MVDSFKNKDQYQEQEIFNHQTQTIIRNFLSSVVKVDSSKPNYCFLIIIHDLFTLLILKEILKNILLEICNSVESTEQSQYYQYIFDHMGNIFEGKLSILILLNKIFLLEQRIINGSYNWGIFDDCNSKSIGYCFQMRIKFKGSDIWRNLTFFAIRPFMVSLLEKSKNVATPTPLLSNEMVTMSDRNIYQSINSMLRSSLSYCLSSLTMKRILSENEKQEASTLQILEGLNRIKG